MYSSMRHPAAANDVDNESHLVDSQTTKPQAAPSRAISRRAKSNEPQSQTPTKKLFERLSATSTAASRPNSARPTVTMFQGGAPRRPHSAPRARPKSAMGMSSHRSTAATAKDQQVAGGAGRRKVAPRPRGSSAGREEDEENMTGRSLNVADLMHGVSDRRASSSGERAGRRDVETAVSVSDFLPKHSPPPAQSAGLRQWCGRPQTSPPASHLTRCWPHSISSIALLCRYDIEIGSVQLQAQKLREQLRMAEQAIALLTAARDRDAL